jgi:membrane protein
MIAWLKQMAATLRAAYTLLRHNDPLILASSTAFFATFSLSPIIIILVNVLGLYFQSNVISKQLFAKLQDIIGAHSSQEIENIVRNFMAMEGNGWITAGGSVFLLFVATTLLGIIRKAIHQLWHIRRKSRVRIKYGVKERLVGLGMLLFMGILFLVSLLLDASVAVFRDYLDQIVPQLNAWVVRGINILFSILVVTAWFTILFKILPEARVHWKVAFAGGLVTSVLFSIGKFILGRLLIESNLENIFGASASLALLLLFIFYSSIIMYFGAAFTSTFGEAIEEPIRPGKYADEYEERLVHTE